MADSVISRRVEILKGHLFQGEEHQSSVFTAEVAAGAAQPARNFDIKLMRQVLERDNFEHRDKVQHAFATDPVLSIPPARFYDMPSSVQREIVLMRMKRLQELGFLEDSVTDYRKYISYSEVCYLGDPNIAVKLNGAHMSLFCGSIISLGTAQHKTKFLEQALKLQILGCFGLTELGHGSNVQGVETTITYDRATQEFVVNTPTETAQKCWIGGAVTAHYSVIFGKLLIDGDNKGIHAVVVQLRNMDGSDRPGVTVADNGHKQGINGVDNGRMWFNNVRVPRSHLLDRFATVSADGTYKSDLPTPVMRFTRAVGELVSGRVFLSAGANIFAKSGIATAIKYGLSRRQFSSGDSQLETLILDYPIHQRRLFPYLASVYVYTSACNVMKDMYLARSEATMKDVHVWASGLKPVVTWNALAALQSCRECCGGNGYATSNRISQYKTDMDVWLTFEGDNYVLLQQVSRHLLKEYQTQMSAGSYSGDLSFMSLLSAPISDNVRSESYQRRAFAEREAVLLTRSAEALQKALMQVGNPMAAWNMCTDVTTELARAHVERISYEAFVAAIAAAPAPVQGPLILLRDLYALWRLHSDVSFWRTTEVAQRDRDRIDQTVNELCAQIRPLAGDLVDSFHIHEKLLGAIAGDWQQKLSKANSRQYW
eukprot:TRINITY_DN6420_c0_g1_i1.p1 TRINITY_DN6420_c0_g1~~TRINITY_DN6420_c0_g1_i1.p1  ORF type:complete len:655 (-),score=152.71 TRINITY_DN6420_c0_g1_i1:39-2003(-)